jgi:hypothetical protein
MVGLIADLACSASASVVVNTDSVLHVSPRQIPATFRWGAIESTNCHAVSNGLTNVRNTAAQHFHQGTQVSGTKFYLEFDYFYAKIAKYNTIS